MKGSPEEAPRSAHARHPAHHRSLPEIVNGPHAYESRGLFVLVTYSTEPARKRKTPRRIARARLRSRTAGACAGDHRCRGRRLLRAGDAGQPDLGLALKT